MKLQNTKNIIDFDRFYSKKGTYFGTNPSDGLVVALKKYSINPGKALDIGAGEGRNSLYLAHLGFEVDALEPTKDGSNKIKDKAKKLNLNLCIKNIDYLSYKSDNKYDFIIAATSLDHMDNQYLKKAIKKLKNSLKIGGTTYIVVFTEDDPGYLKDKNRSSECAPFINHYFKKNELKNYFNDFEILFYDEYKKIDKTHGNTHYHAKAKIIAKKKL